MKKWTLIISVLLMALFYSGCANSPTPIVYNESIPLEESSSLIISGCVVVQFNNEDVTWNKIPEGTSTSFPRYRVIIPAGTHSLKLYTRYVFNNEIYQISAAKDSFEFLPGHTYHVKMDHSLAPLIVRAANVVIFDETTLNDLVSPDSSKPNASRLEGRWVDSNRKHEVIISGDKFVWLTKEKQVCMGFVSTFNNHVNLYSLATYSSGRWKMGGLGTGILAYEFTGTTLESGVIGRIVFRKVE